MALGESDQQTGLPVSDDADGIEVPRRKEPKRKFIKTDIDDSGIQITLNMECEWRPQVEFVRTGGNSPIAGHGQSFRKWRLSDSKTHQPSNAKQ